MGQIGKPHREGSLPHTSIDNNVMFLNYTLSAYRQHAPGLLKCIDKYIVLPLRTILISPFAMCDIAKSAGEQNALSRQAWD